MKITKNTHNIKRHMLLTIAGIFILLIAAYVAYAYIQKTWPFTNNETLENERAPVNQIDYNPPSQQDINENQSGKQRNSMEPTQSAQGSVAISFANVIDDTFEIRAFIPAVIEGSGLCKASVTSGSQVITGTSNGFIDSSYTVCEPIFIPLTQIPGSREVEVTVSYTSNTYNAVSETIKVAI